jgi:adenine-specific DNA-methyltransferase
VVVDPKTLRILGTGEPFSGDDESKRPLKRGKHDLAWPVRKDGRLGIWRTDAAALAKLVERGYAFVSKYDDKRRTYSIKYLLSGTIALIESGEAQVTRDGHRGQVVAENTAVIDKVAKSVWYRPSHNAGKHGSDLLQSLIPGHKFPFPKSLYAVEDCLRFCVLDKPDALIIDFFGGSGTTTHAVARLNHQDGGRRRSILVTNNEVSDEEAKEMRRAGHFPGQPEWESLGIFEHITRPRVVAAFTGLTPDGDEVEGEYKFIDEFPMADGFEENVEFFELTYLDHNSVARGKAFEAVAPLLWMKFGALGPIIAKVKKPFVAPKDANYAVLFDVDRWPEFVAALRERDDVRYACVVTDSLAQFQQVVAEMPPTIGVSMLYEDYLRNFEINTGEGR